MKIRTRLLGPVIAALCLIFLAFDNHAYAVVPGQESIRVLVLKGVNALGIEETTRDGPVRVALAGGGEVTVNGAVKALPITFYPRGGSLLLNGRRYRGTVDIHKDADGLFVVNELPLEAYVAAIINNEISSRWPVEAVKAQAVAARTYALYRKGKSSGAPYHIEGTVAGQVYRGEAGVDPAAINAVRGCRGEILVYKGEPALTVYHSNAGGRTDSALEIWSRDYPYLQSVPSPFDRGAPGFEWDFALPAAMLGRILRAKRPTLAVPEHLSIRALTPAGRVKSVAVTDSSATTVVFTGEGLRSLLGYSILRSTIFTVSLRDGVFIFKGRGSGHGVGLSQWGAKGMAEKGNSYREILGHFYPGASIKRLY